jgi:hypothetical protein
MEQIEVPGLGAVAVHYNIHSAMGQLITFETHFGFAEQDTVITTSTLRFMPQEEIAARLNAAGFQRVKWIGDYDGSRYARTSPEIIVVAS